MIRTYALPTSPSNPARWLLSLVFLIALAFGVTAYAGDRETKQWQGIFHSDSLNKEVTVLLTPPVGPNLGELRFVTLACSVGLQPGPTGSTSYTIVSMTGRLSGPYCGQWLGIQIDTQPVGNRLRLTVNKRVRDFQVTLSEVF